MLRRVATALYESSGAYRVPATHNLLRVAVLTLQNSDATIGPIPNAVPQLLLQSCIAGMAASYVRTGGPSAVTAQIERHTQPLAWLTSSMAKRHVECHCASSSGVPIPLWPRMTKERVELDVVWPEATGGAPLDLERCNAAVLLHDVEEDGSNLSTMTDALERTLQALPDTLPVVVVGLVPAATLRGGSFGLRSLHGRWSRPHTQLARRFPSVYATSYVAPELIGQVRWGAVVLGGLLLALRAQTRNLILDTRTMASGL